MASAGASRVRRRPLAACLKSRTRPRRYLRAAGTTAPPRRTSRTFSASARRACTTTTRRKKPRSRRYARAGWKTTPVRAQRILRSDSRRLDQGGPTRPPAPRAVRRAPGIHAWSSCGSGASCRSPRAGASAPASSLRAHHSARDQGGCARAVNSARDLDARMATLALLGLGNSAALWIAHEPGATRRARRAPLRRNAGARVQGAATEPRQDGSRPARRAGANHP